MRLTKKITGNDYSVIANDIDLVKCGDNAINKLGQLEDIEERMNFNIYQLIDTETFYRRDVWTNEFVKEDLKDWFIDITNQRLVKIKYLVKSFRCNADIISNTFEQISFYDYGKQNKTTDWALTKEELK